MTYDIIVVGGGHAGVEAAVAAATLGHRTLLTTISLDHIALMPCNPSVGGPGKSHLVRELDALGGVMGLVADKTAIQIKLLNTGKGPAVQSLRSQADKVLYQRTMKELVENTPNLTVKQMLVDRVIIENGKATGIVTEYGDTYTASAIILATGTYLQGKIITGETTYNAGPNGQRAALKLTQCLVDAGLRIFRFKTGTPPRVDRRTLDFTKMIIQPGDEDAPNFSFLTKEPTRRNIPCYLTYTNERTHEIIRQNLHRAPMANGVITGIGPRYCPSIETKIARFPEKERHQLFIEPEGLHTNEMYVQGMSTSLPIDVQRDFIRTIAGLENAEIMRAGYAIEYDCFDPTELMPSLELKKVENLFSAGQSNGTSGYEEAAAQGLIAGINASLKLRGRDALILKRSESYIGVLIDDLVTKGTKEPYRIMTSMAEYRLLLRQDNADLRLTDYGREVGLVSDERYELLTEKKAAIQKALDALQMQINPNVETNAILGQHGLPEIKTSLTLYDYLKRATTSYQQLVEAFGLPTVTAAAAVEVETQARYEGYIRRQKDDVERMAKLEAKKLSPSLDYNAIDNLSLEAREKLLEIRPVSIGQASRIAGVSPADISVLLIYLEATKKSS